MEGEGKEETKKKLFSPSVQLFGHQHEVYTAKFSHCGNYLATGGHDRPILLWDVFDPKCKNFAMLKGHSNSVLDLAWSRDSTVIYSCGADRTLCIWDVPECTRVRRYHNHENIVNDLDASTIGSELIVTASDDFSVRLWEPREKNPISKHEVTYQVTAVCFSKTNELVFFGGIDNQVKAWNIRADKVEYTLIGHTDTVTGIALSSSGTKLLSNSVDHTMR